MSKLIRLNESNIVVLKNLKMTKGKNFSYNTIIELLLKDFVYFSKEDKIVDAVRKDLLKKLILDLKDFGFAEETTPQEILAIDYILEGRYGDAVNCLLSISNWKLRKIIRAQLTDVLINEVDRHKADAIANYGLEDQQPPTLSVKKHI